MSRLHRLEGGPNANGTSTYTGPSSLLPSIPGSSPLDESEKKFMPMPPQRSGKPYSKKNTQLHDSRIHLEPLRPPTAGGNGTGGRISTRLTVSSSSGRVSWDSTVMEAGSTILENMAAFRELDRKLQFYKTLAGLKMRDAAQSEQSLQKTLTCLLVAAASALDATAVVLYSLSTAKLPVLKVVACSSSGPGIVGFQTSLETFSLRGLVEQFGVNDEIALTAVPAATYVVCLRDLGTYDVSCDVDSVLGFTTASVLAGVLPDEHGRPRFVMEARSAQEGLAFSKEFMRATLTAVENAVYPFELRKALVRQTRSQFVAQKVLRDTVGPGDSAVESEDALSSERLSLVAGDSERLSDAEAEWLHSPDVGQLAAEIMAVAPVVSGLCLIELHSDKCEVLASHGKLTQGEAFCAVVGSTNALLQRLLDSARTHVCVDLSDDVALNSALQRESNVEQSLIFLPVPTSRGAKPCGVLCLCASNSFESLASMLEVESELPFETQVQPILAAIALALTAKQRSDDLRASTRQKRQLLALCRSHLLVESVRDPSSLVSLICEMGSAVFHTSHVTLYVSDTIKKELWSLSSLSSVNGLRIPYGRGIAGHVAETKEPLTVHKPYEDPRFDRSFDAKFGFKTECLLTQPVLDRAGETVGVLQAVNFGQFPAASPPVARYDDDVMAHYLRLVAHALHVNSSLIIFAKVQADYWSNRSAQDTAREEGSRTERNDRADASGAGNGEVGVDTKHEVASVHSLLDLSGFDEAKCIPRNKWSTFAYACWVLGRFIKRLAKSRSHQQAQVRHGRAEQGLTDDDEEEDSDGDQEETGRVLLRPRVRSRTASVVRASRTHSVITRWHRMTLGQDGYGQVEELLRDNFDPLTKSISELENYAYQLFEGLVLIGTFRIEIITLRMFIGELASKYRDVPYHSFYHGFDVALASYTLMRSPEVLSVIKELEALSLLVAALGHDADHPGNDNQFEVDSSSALALCYNDISVLENHHAATTFSVLKMPGCDILRDLSANARASARTHIVRCILGTDMKHHTKLLSELAVVGNIHEFSNVPEGRQLMLNMIIHGADLGSVGRPLRVALKWVDRVCTEFTQQAERSAELGLNVPPHLLNLQDEATRCRLQINFIDYLVAPLWATIAHLVPAAKATLDNLRANRLYFSEQATLLAAKPHN
ncbi:3'5'-cyclic nucleotide phosphodiesterase [Phytophthora infestans]|uniref:3'5'-cyclic nucleotide phosphodiesterase n=1 Tax=Phytophthora infestans TaxID=4787 RepID=A0A8S9UA35_PHYIN|nr:3'5'-cyclic nucleotide phosphodiesterase [Phytophthora infestans]